MGKDKKGMPEMITIERVKTKTKKVLTFAHAETMLKNEHGKHVTKKHHKLATEGFVFNGTDIVRVKDK